MELAFLVISVCLFAFAVFSILIQILRKNEIVTKTRIEDVFGEKTANQIRKKQKKLRKNDQAKQLFGKRILDNLTLELSLAGIRLRAEEFLMIWIFLAIVPMAVSFAWKADWLISLALFLCGVVLPWFFVKKAKGKRMALFELQLSDALIIIGNCLRTGLSFEQAITSIARDMPDPIAKEFGRVIREIQLGLTMEEALENMVKRLKSDDFMLIVAAVLIQRQVGGNLSEILDGISDTIRERLKIKTSIKVLTASGRISGMVVGLMPVFILLVLMMINPSYIRMFFTTQIGMMMLCAAGCLEVIGFFFVRKIVNIKF